MSDELIHKSDVLALLSSLDLNLIDYGLYIQLLDMVDNMPPVNAVELPCKIGDEIYGPCRCGRVHAQTVKGFTVSDHVEMINCEMINRETKNYSVREIGNTAFLTREEAEKALEEMKNE